MKQNWQSNAVSSSEGPSIPGYPAMSICGGGFMGLGAMDGLAMLT